MTFKLASIAVLSLFAVGESAKVDTIPNFLEPEDIEHLVSNQEDTDRCLSEERSFQPFQLPKTLRSSLWSALTNGSGGVNGNHQQGTETIKNGQITTLYQTTTPHVDCIMTSEGEQGDRVEDSVAFVFLNDNEKAYFTQGNQKIPVEQGKLVMFHGNEEHQTVIPENSPPVKILGPFAVSGARKLSLVGMEVMKGKKGKKGKKGDVDPCVFANPAILGTELIVPEDFVAVLFHQLKLNEWYLKAIDAALMYGVEQAVVIGMEAGEKHASMPFLGAEQICTATFVIVAQMAETCDYEENYEIYRDVSYYMMTGFAEGAGVEMDFMDCEQPESTIPYLGECDTKTWECSH